MHRSGFINIIGNPNVGKSTLMNNLVGEKLSIITSKAQTTRHRILGIVNGDNFQLIFSDTPGIIKPSYELQDSMMDFVKSALEDADVLIYMVEIGEKSIKDSEVHDKIQSAKIPTIILLNKIDLLQKIEEATINQKAGNFLKANKIFQELLKSNSDSFDFLYAYGLFCRDLKNFNLAKRVFLSLINKFPSSIFGQINTQILKYIPSLP